MPAARRTMEPRPSAPTTRGAVRTAPSARVTVALPASVATVETAAGARTAMPDAVTAWARAARMRRFSTMYPSGSPPVRPPISSASKRRKAGEAGRLAAPGRRPSVTRIWSMRQACGRSASPSPSASIMRKVEKAMAVERPSKVGASWASNGWGSIITTFSPPCAAARANAAPVRPAPAMMMS